MQLSRETQGGFIDLGIESLDVLELFDLGSSLPAPTWAAAGMILGPVSLLDCVVFVIFLIPQLLYQAGVFSTVLVVIKVLPFLGMSTYRR